MTYTRREDEYSGVIQIELTGLAVMRQRRTLTLPKTMTESEVETLIKETVGDYVWDYQELIDDSVDITIVS